MEGYVTAQVVANVLSCSSRAVRGWLKEGIIPGIFVDEGPGKKTWYTRLEDVFACTDPRVTKYFKNTELTEHRTADQVIRDQEGKIAELESALSEKREALEETRKQHETEISELTDSHQKSQQELGTERDKYTDCAFAAAQALHAAVQQVGAVEAFLEESGIRIEHEMLNGGKAWNLSYIIKGKNRYRTQDFRCESCDLSQGLNLYLLSREAGHFRDCRRPSTTKLQARGLVYGYRLKCLSFLPFILGLMFMFKGKPLWLTLCLFALSVVWVVVVDLYYRIRMILAKDVAHTILDKEPV